MRKRSISFNDICCCILLSLIVGKLAVPCCFCKKEFPMWSNAVTSHIASHVKLKSIRCIQCCLNFTSKETLMSHLHSCHSSLPEGICIDVSIANHERRHLHCKTEPLPCSETLHSSEALLMKYKQDSSAKMQHIDNVIRNENFADKYKAQVTEADGGNIDLKGCDVTSDSNLEHNGKSSVEHTDNSSMFETDNSVRNSAEFLSSKACKRKSRKPSHIFANDAGCVTDPDWVEIVAATRPMVAQCPHCTFTCNTDLQLKV